MLGGGLEYALTRDWSAKAEYQYIALGTTEGHYGLNDKAQGNGAIGYVTAERDLHTVRAGLNYHLVTGYEPLK